MTILGSREYMCIHPTVSKGKDKNEACKKLLKGSEVVEIAAFSLESCLSSVYHPRVFLFYFILLISCVYILC